MESTCKKEMCFMWEKEGEKCPLFINTMWASEGTNQSKILDDCAPKRNTILLMDYSNRGIGMQQDYEKQKSKFDNVLRGVSEVVTEMQKRNKMLSDKLGIVYDEECIELIEEN